MSANTKFNIIDFLGDFRGPVDIADLLVQSDMAESKNKARNLVEQGGVRFNDIKVQDKFAKIFFHKNIDGVLVILENDNKNIHIIGDIECHTKTG